MSLEDVSEPCSRDRASDRINSELPRAPVRSKELDWTSVIHSKTREGEET